TIDNGTLVLSGGRLEVGEDVSITSDLTNLDKSTVQIAAGMTLSHSGAELNIGPHTLTLTGGGTFANTNHLTLDDPASVLELDDVAHVSKVAIPAELESGKVEVLQDTNLQTLSHAGSSRIEIANEKTLTVSAATEIPPGKSLQLIGAGGTLSLADTLTLSGTLHFVAEGTLNNGTLALNGGLLDVDENTTITTNLNQLSDSVVNVASGKTLTYLGSALDIGSNELTLSGGGTLVNPNDFRLSDPASVLNLSGVAELESVAIPEVLTTGKLTVDNHTGIKRLSLAGSSQFDLADDIRLSVDGAFEVPSGRSLELIGNRSSLSLNNTLTLSGTLKFAGPGNVLDNGTLLLNGGALEVEDNTTITANLTQQADSSISVLAGKTLVYPGDALEIGSNRLTISGGGVLGNENNLVLNDPSSVLSLNGIAKVAKVAVTGALTQGKLAVTENVLVETLLHSGSSRIDIAAGKQLTVAEPVSVQSGQSLELVGLGGGTWVHDNLTLSGTLKISAADTTLDNGTVILNGSLLDIDENTTISSDLVHEADSTVDVFTDKTLTYSGAPLKIGSSALTLIGGGRIANANELVMNDPIGVLTLDGIAEVEQVTVTGVLETGRLNVFQDAVIQTVVHSGSSKVNLDKGIRLTVSEAFEVPSSQTMELVGSGGTLALSDNLTLSGTLRFSGSDNTM
ncbi:MAG: hypothetical protein QGH12_11080, partial [SAR324 cluster bacterium]|nr:hypothetical protein [SAR324 cluster bacterium]